MRNRHQNLSLNIFKDPEPERFRPDFRVAESEPSYLKLKRITIPLHSSVQITAKLLRNSSKSA